MGVEIYMPPACAICKDRAYWFEFGSYRCQGHRYKCPQNEDKPHVWVINPAGTNCKICGVRPY